MLAQELHKPVIKQLNQRKVYATFNDNIWGADLAEMGSLLSKNLRTSLCVINVSPNIGYLFSPNIGIG